MSENFVAAIRQQRRIMELVAFEFLPGGAKPAGGGQRRIPVAKIHPALGETGLDPEEAGHAVSDPGCVGQSGAECHIAPALAMYRAIVSKTPQTAQEICRIGEASGVQFG